jgi:hypothetical protein
MTTSMGERIIGVLEEAGRRYLGATDSRAYSILLLQIGGTDALRTYDASKAYWRHVQAVLDTFFSSAQRAEIGSGLIDQPELRARPEFRDFLAHALAERRLQELIRAAAIASSAVGRPPLAPAPRSD